MMVVRGKQHYTRLLVQNPQRKASENVFFTNQKLTLSLSYVRFGFNTYHIRADLGWVLNDSFKKSLMSIVSPLC